MFAQGSGDRIILHPNQGWLVLAIGLFEVIQGPLHLVQSILDTISDRQEQAKSIARPVVLLVKFNGSAEANLSGMPFPIEDELDET